MDMTAKGAQAAMLGAVERLRHANALMRGQSNIHEYMNGICYDAAAYVRYLHNAAITPNELVNNFGSAWLMKFRFTDGREWDGSSQLPVGKAIGFYREIDTKIFHGAIAVDGQSIRAINGLLLGNGWSDTVNLSLALGRRNDDGTFNFDRTQIRVYISNL
jgi:hypothetical protein